MRPKRALAVGQVLFMFPAILFMGALIVRELRAAVILAIVGMHMLAN